MSFTKTDLVQKEALEKRYGSLNCPVQGPWNDVIGTMFRTALLGHISLMPCRIPRSRH